MRLMARGTQASMKKEQHRVIENPHNYDFWDKSDYATVANGGTTKTYIADHCSFGASNEMNEPVRKRTRIDATFATKASVRHSRCRVARRHLTGAVGGIKRKARAAAHPKSPCDSLIKEIFRMIRNAAF